MTTTLKILYLRMLAARDIHYTKFIGNRMARHLKIAGLSPSLTPHSLRHTHVSLLAETGVSLEQIMKRLGHSDDDTTRKVYLHVTKKMKTEAAHKFSELMNSLQQNQACEQNVNSGNSASLNPL